MSTDSILDEIKVVTGGRVYNDKMLFFAAFFGGPLAAGYLMISNYRSLGQYEKVSFAWLTTILSTFLYMIAIIVVESYIIELPGLLYSLLCVFASKAVFANTQEAAVVAHLEEGGTLHSNWRVAGIIATAFMIILMLSVAVLSLLERGNEFASADETVTTEVATEAGDDTEAVISRTYGDLDHVITFDRTQINPAMVNELANKLFDLEFLGQSQQRQIYLDVDVDNYMFFIVETEEQAANLAVQQRYTTLKNELIRWLNANSLVILLVDETWQKQYVSL
jgi:hypothetical protein